MKPGIRLGLISGIILGIVYMLLIYIKYTFFSFTPFAFYLCNFVSYIIIIFGLFMIALKRRNELGGYGEVKTLFQPIFIAVIVLEICYVVFTYIYLNNINTAFFDTFLESTKQFMAQRDFAEGKAKEQIEIILQQKEASHDFWLLAKGILGRWVIIDSIIGFVVAFIMQKKNPNQIIESEIKRVQF